jgi:CRISPR-associated protein Cmr4
MVMHHRLLVLLAESPLHAGGAAAEGALDLPIQREASTGLPVIWGQSLKGALRDAAHREPWVTDVFGGRPPSNRRKSDTETAAAPTDAGEEQSPGQVSFGDAQLLAFPVATLLNTFAWTTSKVALNRLLRKVRILGSEVTAAVEPIVGPCTNSPYVLATTAWKGKQVFGPLVADDVRDTAATQVTQLGRLIATLACLDEQVFDFTRAKLAADTVVVHDDGFSDLTRNATEVVARIQLREDQKTVAKGPFYVEHLPVETILVAVLSAREDRPLQHLQNRFDGNVIQVGGDETVGKGLAWCRIHTADDVITAARSIPAQED